MRLRLSCLALLAVAACLQPPAAPEEQTVIWTTAEQQAIEEARTKLAQHTGISPQLIGLVRIEARQWPDASLGCPQPHSSHAQILASGHIVTLKAGNRSYQVHVAANDVVVCDPLSETAPAGGTADPAEDGRLEAMAGLARADLAARLGIDPRQIRDVSTQPRNWPDGELECGQASPAIAGGGPVEGFVLTYEAHQRLFHYHTDLERVLPCPPLDIR